MQKRSVILRSLLIVATPYLRKREIVEKFEKERSRRFQERGKERKEERKNEK